MSVLRPTLRVLSRGAAILLVALVIAEVVLQAFALFAGDRGAGWRPEAAHRILCVGDSHTYGAFVSAEESYPGRLQRLLDRYAPGAYSVVNLGIPGMNTAQVRDRLRAALGGDRPDTVIVWCGVNNAWNRTETTPAQSRWSGLTQAVRRSRVYRLVQVWRHDRRLENVLAQVAPAEQQRYEVMDNTDPDDPQRRRLAVVSGDRTEQLAFDDTGFRVDAGMEERAARDYRQMVEDCRAAGVPVAFVAYPVETDAFRRANSAVRRVAAEFGVPVVESARSVRRVPRAQREMLWAGHPNGPMYGEIARDVLRVVLGGFLTGMTFETVGSPDPLSVNGACQRTTAGCASGTGCYRWNPRGTVCNIREALPETQHPVRASVRFRVDDFPAGATGYDILALSEETYATGIYVQFTNRDQVRLVSMGSNRAEGTCGPLASRVAPDTWYGLRVHAEKSDHARATLELLTAGGEVVDSVTCADLPAGGGTFTSVTLGSTNGFGATADILFDDVAVYEEAA